MTITAAGLVDWATYIPGPPDKRYSQRNRMVGVAHHSVVGRTGTSDKLDRVFSTNRNADGTYTDYAAMSVVFYLREDGRLIQYYPIWTSCWCSGNATANTSLISIEHEGGGPQDEDGDGLPYNTPITQAQSDTLIRLYADIDRYLFAQAMPWEATRGGEQASILWGNNPAADKSPADRTLFEHREVALWDIRNAGPTACPSDRFRNHWPRVAGIEDIMDGVTRREYEDLLLATYAGAEENDAGALRPREVRLANAAYRRDQAAAGLAPSVAETAASAMALAQQSQDSRPALGGGMTQEQAQHIIAAGDELRRAGGVNP